VDQGFQPAARCGIGKGDFSHGGPIEAAIRRNNPVAEFLPDFLNQLPVARKEFVDAGVCVEELRGPMLQKNTGEGRLSGRHSTRDADSRHS
jgi:hypothetical protein